MNDQVKPTPSSWRRFPRFSVRGLIVIVLVIGAWLGWLVRGARIQREAVFAIKKAGGHVSYSWEYCDGQPIPSGTPSAPSWLVNLIGVEFFGHVTHVDFSGSSGRVDSTLVEVGRLNQLEELWLGNASVTDDALVHLEGLTNLSVVWLSSNRVSDAGLAHLRGLTNLSIVGLNDTRVTDAGLAHLKGLTNLQILELSDTRVTNAGIKDLKQALPKLTIER